MNYNEKAAAVRHARRLAADPDFVREHLEFSASYNPDDEPGLTADEFAERYLGSKP